jgi:hypothetical protein
MVHDAHPTTPSTHEERRDLQIKLASVLSVVFAMAAALLWGCSALVNIPTLKSGFGTLVSVMQGATTVLGEAPFYDALATISRLNAAAAGCALLSALSQAMTLRHK